MKFSIITASSRRDSKRLIDLESNLMIQDNHDFEWIVACNCAHLRLLPADFKIRHVRFAPDTLGAAWNQAVHVANGQNLIFLDADDYLISGTLKQLSKVLRGSDSRTLVDLNRYSTYEPKNIFINSIRDGNSNADALPQTPYHVNHFQPVRREFNYSKSLLSRIHLNKSYRDWLTDKYWLFSGHNRFENLATELSVEGKVIPHSLAIGAQFDSQNRLNPAMTFMAKVLCRTQFVILLSDYHYILVEHNDPINDPSLIQLNSPHRWSDWLQACLKSLRIIQHNSNRDLVRAFGRLTVVHLHRYFYKAVVMEMHSVGSVDFDFKLLRKYLNLLNRTALNAVNLFSRNVLKSIAHGHFKLAKQKMAVLVASRDVRSFIDDHHQTAIYESYRLLFKHLPVNPRVIIYESFIGRSYSDNPKYIYLDLQKHYPGRFIHVWIADSLDYHKIKSELKDQPNTVVVNKFGAEYMYYLAISKYQVFNMRQPRWFVKRPGTYFLETWHGTPLKRLVFDLDNIANAPLYKKGFYYQTKQWDHLLTDNQFSYQIFQHAFMYPARKMLKTGYPRNDVLSSPRRQQIARKVKQKLGIPLNKKVILYAPTWRDDQTSHLGRYQFQLKLNVAKMRRLLGQKYVMILRTHYFVTNHLDLSDYRGFVFNESGYDDISELYLVSDLLITDYSSVFFDYANLKRPIIYFAYDYDHYAGVLRGFYLNMKKDLPGPILKTSDQVIDAILHLDRVKAKYHQRYVRFNQRFNSWDDGHAAQRVVKQMLNY